MPSTDRSLPSQEFLVKQATLAALVSRYPATVAMRGRAVAAYRLMGIVRDEFEEGRDFCAAVRAEYRALVSSFQARVAA